MDESGKPTELNGRRTHGASPSERDSPSGPRPGETQAFILRLWAEPRELDRHAPVWRGSISDLKDENKRYFADWGGLKKVILEAVGIPGTFEGEGR
jgi:hypothetical protein